MNNDHITITIRGPRGSGTTLVGQAIRRLLEGVSEVAFDDIGARGRSDADADLTEIPLPVRIHTESVEPETGLVTVDGRVGNLATGAGPLTRTQLLMERDYFHAATTATPDSLDLTVGEWLELAADMRVPRVAPPAMPVSEDVVSIVHNIRIRVVDNPVGRALRLRHRFVVVTLCGSCRWDGRSLVPVERAPQASSLTELLEAGVLRYPGTRIPRMPVQWGDYTIRAAVEGLLAKHSPAMAAAAKIGHVVEEQATRSARNLEFALADDHLDAIGANLDLPRSGDESDDRYRRRLQARVRTISGVEHKRVDTTTKMRGVNSNRPRTRVECMTCRVVVHEATTGPDLMWEAHVGGRGWQDEPMGGEE